MRVLRVQAYCTRAAVLLLCFASGLEVPQLRASALSIAVGDSIAQARALLVQPSCCASHSPQGHTWCCTVHPDAM